MSRFSIDWSELSLQVMVTFGLFLWQACVIGFVLFVAQHVGESLRDSQILRRRRSTKSNVSLRETDLRGANLRYTIACLAFFSLPICVVATFAMVHQSRGSIFLATNNPIETPAIPTASEIRSNPPLASNGVQVLGSPEIPADPLLTSRAQLSFVEPIDKPDPRSPGTTWVELAQSNAPYLLIAYAIGVALMLTRFGISIMGSSRLHRTLQPIADSNLLKIIAAQSSRLGLKRVPIVAICQRVSVPVVVGIVKPMILLPPALLCGLGPNQIAAILSHEMAHIRRYDLLVNLLQRIVEALLFFHPVTWWISRRMSIERENCCDDVAAACTGRLSYASALLQMAELCVSNDRRRRTALTALSADGGNTTEFGDRIRRLINAEETTRVGVTFRSFAVGLTILLLLTASLVAWGQNGKSAGEKPDDESMSKIFNPEPLWQTKLTADDAASEMSRVSPVVVATDRVLSIGHDFDLQTGKLVPNPFARLPRTYEFKVTVDPVFRRSSSDRAFIVEALNRAPGNTWSMPSYDLRVLRASDGEQVGVTLTIAGHFNWSACDVDVENGGDFLLLGTGNEVRVYRTETGQVETTMPVKTKRIDAVAISPDRQWLVVSDQNDLHFWRWRDQAPVKSIYAGRTIDCLVFTPDGQYLAEGPDSSEDIQIRDMRTLEIVASLKDEVGSPLMVSSMDISPDGRYLVAHNEVSVDQTKLTIPHRIHVWDLKERGKPVFQIATGEWVRKVAFTDDGNMIVGEFSGAAHGALLAAWKLPDEVINRRVDSSRGAQDRLGDGIQWSRWGDKDGLRSGARLVLPKDGLKPGQPLVVEYRLANVTTETKTLKCYLNKGMQFTSLGHGNRIGGFLDWHREPVTLNIEPGEVFIDTEHLVSIDTTGLEPGKYQVALGSAFHDPEHEIPHRGSIPFTIAGKSTLKTNELPESEIHWGKPIAGLQLGARYTGDTKQFKIGATVEADLFVANVTDQPIECAVVLPHPGDGWLFNVEDRTGSTIMLERKPPIDFWSPQRFVHLKLAPGEMVPITGEGVQISYSSASTDDAFATILPKAKFQAVGTKEEANQPWKNGNDNIQGRLISQGGAYSAIFDVTLLRPEIPAMRLELDTGNVPFTVLKLNENGRAVEEADNTLEGIRQAVIQALQNPKAELGSNPIAPQVLPDFTRKLRAIPQQEQVIDSLFDILADPPAEIDIDERRNVLSYLIFEAPDRLKTLLMERLSTMKLLFPDTKGIALPYDEIDALGQMGEAASDAIPVLTKFLNAEEPEVRGTAIEALIRVGPRSSEVMQSIATRFDDPHKVVRGLAVYQVGRYGKLANPLGPKFIELLNADTNEVLCRAAAALITSDFNPDLGFKKLLELIRAGSIVDRKLALSSLAMLGSRAESVLPQLRLMIDDRNTELAREVRETIRRIETNDRIVTHAEEAAKKATKVKGNAVSKPVAGSELRVEGEEQVDADKTDDQESSIRSLKNSNWITSPQLCVGKAYSNTAKAANWKWDEEQRVSLATPESGEMLTSVLPVGDADFVVQAKLKLIDNAQCRLTMGESTFDVANSGDRTRLVVAGKEYAFENDNSSREWTLLSLRRRDNKLSVRINEQAEVELGVNAQAFEKISLQSARGTIAVSNFVVTGNVQRVNQAQVAPGNTGLQILKARYVLDTDSNESQSDALKTLPWKFGDGKTQNVQIDMQAPLISESDILGIEACSPLILQLTQVAQGRVANATKQPTDTSSPTPLLAVLLQGELVGVTEIRNPIKAEQRILIPWGNSSKASDRIREYVTPKLVNYHCQGVPETAPDKSFSISTKVYAVESSRDGKCQLIVQYRFNQPRDKSIQVECMLEGKTETRTLNSDQSIDVTVVNDPHPGRYKVIPKIVADGDHFNIESTVIRSLDGVATHEAFTTPVVAVRLLTDTDAVDDSKQAEGAKTDLRERSFRLVDGESGNSLPGLECQAVIAKLNTSPRYQECTTDEHGVVEVVVAKDESAGIADVPSGWFANGVGSVFVVQIPESEQQPQQNIEKRNEEPTVLKLWRGTEVDGRLLWPDKTPAAGVKLTAGVYINNQSWKEKLGMDLTWYSFDHGDWPNWSRMIVTDDDGKFRITVPPRDSRFWFRIGTTQLGFGPQTGTGEDEAVSQRLAKCVPLEIQYGGNSRSTALIVHDIPETDDLVLHTGDLQLETGVIVRGRVVDAEGKGLSNVHLTTTGPHGPHSGRSATSGEDGKFEFPAMAAGNLVVHPDARLRDLTKPVHEQIISRDVQAVFVDQSFTIRSVFLPHEIIVRAVPHTEVTFDWVDRRADKTQPIAFYGAFRVRGDMPDENGKPATYWTSETERIERNGKQWLTVKIPAQLLKPELMLVADSKVTASYSDSTGVTSGPGIVGLGDITADTTRTIFGDEPREPADSKKSPQRDRNDQSSWIPARPLKVTASKDVSAIILDDHSVRLEGDVRWQEVSLQFKFDKPTNVQEVRLEVLPVDSPTGPQFGRGGEELMLFDVKPSIQDQTGKFTSLDFASCTYLQNPSDETSANCIDYLSDTGWKVPKLPAEATAHELVLRFEKPMALRADQALTLTVDSGGAKELAILNRIRFAFRQGAVSEPLSVNSTTSGSDVGALVTTGGANEKVEPWEISKLYKAAFLRTFLQDHETLPKPIVVPPVSGKVFDPNGNPASGVRIVSHTPRHWVDLDATLALKPHNGGGVKNSKKDGTFGLPERTEPYRVLFVHESGVANVSHEELLRANGIVTLQKWASVSGTLKLDGKPQAGETIVLHFDTLPWSYSRGGPRLTTTHRSTTDKDGNFSFDRVPPLGGMAYHVSRAGSLGHGAVYQCESGKNTHIEIGAGITVTGKLSFPEHVAKNKLKVYARNHLLPIPYPKDWTDKVTEEERNAWRVKWSRTAEGCELEDRNFVLMNSGVPGSISEVGEFTIYGVPERPMVLVVAIPGEAILLEQPFHCTGSANDTLDLGTLTVADNHDHNHDEVKQEDRPADKHQLPRLIVKTVDSDGKPVPDTGVLFYDRNSHRAGQKQEFERVDRRTDESGVADFGVIPNSFGCLQLSPSNKELAECYTLISTTLTKCTQAKPPRANVQTEIKDGILTVTFTMTPHVDLEFNIVDDATDEIVFWSEICYQDPTTDRWWMFGLVDGSKTQHNFIPISPQITREMIRISALGYETKVFRLPDELDRSKPIRRDVRLKPMPDVELKVLLLDGTPAEKAKLTFHYPNELDCLQDHEQLSDAKGIVTTKFPPSADIGILRLEHTGGTAELSMKELLDDAKQNSAEVVRRSIQLR